VAVCTLSFAFHLHLHLHFIFVTNKLSFFCTNSSLFAGLAIIEPSRGQILDCLEKHPLKTSPKIPELIDTLKARGTDVYFVSGGFRIMIEPLAESLGVPVSNIVANTIFFDEEGSYTGFCKDEPTSADQGKPKAVQMLKEKHGYETVVMVGDGATDAQAKREGAADAFLGFGGIADRDAVREKADWFVYDFGEVVEMLREEDSEDFDCK